MYFILIGFLLLFLRINFTLFDDSLVFIITNFIGYVLLRMGIENSDEADELYMKDSLWFYLVLNLALLFCRIYDITVNDITTAYIESYLLRMTLIFVHIYLFVYPLYLFYKCVSYLELQSKCLKSKALHIMIKSCVVLAIVVTISTNLFLNLQYLWGLVIFMQMTALLLLKKFAVPFKS